MNRYRSPILAIFAILFISAPAMAAEPNDMCLMFGARNIAKGNGNFYMYVPFSSKKLTIEKGDVLSYDVYLDKADPYAAGGVDIDTDRGNLRDSAAVDQDNHKA